MERLIESGKYWMKEALDLLFPRRCPFCGKLWDGICDDCRSKHWPIEHPYCFRCGRPVRKADWEVCESCREQQHFFDRGRALYVYQDAPARAVLMAKHENRRENLEYFAREMVREFGTEIKKWQPQALIPIPMYGPDQKKRGYNQARILAAHLGELLDIPVIENFLVKEKKTEPQKELDHRKRRRNLKGAFQIQPDALEGIGQESVRRVLLVDDVFTTGSTLDEAAKTLKNWGTEEVFFATVCIVGE